MAFIVLDSFMENAADAFEHCLKYDLFPVSIVESEGASEPRAFRFQTHLFVLEGEKVFRDLEMIPPEEERVSVGDILILHPGCSFQEVEGSAVYVLAMKLEGISREEMLSYDEGKDLEDGELLTPV